MVNAPPHPFWDSTPGPSCLARSRKHHANVAAAVSKDTVMSGGGRGVARSGNPSEASRAGLEVPKPSLWLGGPVARRGPSGLSLNPGGSGSALTCPRPQHSQPCCAVTPLRTGFPSLCRGPWGWLPLLGLAGCWAAPLASTPWCQEHAPPSGDSHKCRQPLPHVPLVPTENSVRRCAAQPAQDPAQRGRVPTQACSLAATEAAAGQAEAVPEEDHPAAGARARDRQAAPAGREEGVSGAQGRPDKKGLHSPVVLEPAGG